MHVSAFAFSFVLALTSVAAHAPDVAQRRHHARMVPADYHQPLESRELAGQGFNDTGPTEPSASGSSSAVSSSATSSQPPSSQQDQSSSSTAPSSSASPSAVSAPSSTALPSSSAQSSAPSSVAPPSTSSASSSAAPLTQSSTLPSAAPPSTLSQPAQTTVVTTTQSKPALITGSGSSPSASGAANNLNSNDNSNGGSLSKGALIAIIVVAVVVGGGAIAFTLFRKMKLKKSKRFNSRMKSIDFGPGANMHGDDDFFEKTLHRSNSNSTAANQRNMLAAEVDGTNHVAGIPEHDFTAAPSHQPNATGVYDMYNQDPYYHAEAYEYTDPTYGHAAYSVTPGVGAYNGGTHADQLTQDQPVNNGYADLQRGNSNGSGSGHGHQHTHAAQPQVYATEFPNPESYLGRPTGHGEGPYAQAAVYRGAY